MSIDDFERCTPTEFNAIHTAWHRAEQLRLQNQWERTRQLCTCMLQPYASQRITPEDVMVFPWDASAIAAEAERKMSDDERKARYERALANYGLSSNKIE